MSEFCDSLITRLNEADAIERGQLKGRKTVYEIQPIKKYNNIEIKHIRNSVGMTQVLFANYMGVSLKTVEAWEKGTNHPTGTACRLISMLENHTFEALPFVKRLSQDFYANRITCSSASTVASTPSGIIHRGVACPILRLYTIGKFGLLISLIKRRLQSS